MIKESEIALVLEPARLEAELNVNIDEDRLKEIMAGAPPELLPIAHYAAIWGIVDDGYRLDFISNTNKDARKNLNYVIDKYYEYFNPWLAGSEAESPSFSEAYLAFSCLRMAADEVRDYGDSDRPGTVH